MSEQPHLPPQNLESPHRELITMPSKEHFAELERQYQAKEAVRQQQLKEHNAAYDRRKWKMRMKKTLAATALFATAQSGGFADMAADPFNDAGDTVRSAITIEPVLIPNEMDGIKFSDYSKAVQREHIQEQTDRVELESATEATFASLFERIDQDGTEWLVAEVKAEKMAHPELYVSDEKVEQAKESIENAESNDEAVNHLNTFMKEYGIAAGFAEARYENMTSQTKKALLAYVNVFAPLPKNFLARTNLQRVSVSNTTERVYDDVIGAPEGTKRGKYRPNDHEIVVFADNALEVTFGEAARIFSPVETAYENTVAHELGHAISHEMPVSAVLKAIDGSKDPGFIESSEHVARSIVGRTEVPTLYSMEDSEEYTAELLAGLLSDSHSGLFMPNEVRQFTSTNNKALIDTLANLERVHPGIAKIIIANRES